jgi:hypothetical protein
MKTFLFVFGACLVSVLAGCASAPPEAVAPVGPNPNGTQNLASSTGTLQVFSREIERRDDRELGGDGIPPWYQHGDYTVYDMNGNTVRHVENSEGRYARDPVVVDLAPGKYMVKAQMADFSWVKVPVTIERGRLTGVHLDDKWQPPAGAPKGALVTMPDGKPIGWVSIDNP